jgi:hypothetical protein
MTRAKKEYRGDKECFSMFILLSDTCIKNKLTRDYCAKLHPGTFQKYRLFLYLYVGGGVKTPPLFIHYLRHTYGTSSLEAKTSFDAAVRRTSVWKGHVADLLWCTSRLAPGVRFDWLLGTIEDSIEDDL